MSKKNKVSLLSLIFWISCVGASAQSIHLATYNIRFDNPGDHGNLWQDRLPQIVKLIQFHELDIIGTQEGLNHQIAQLSQATGMANIGNGRDPNNQGEFSSILYHPDKFKALTHQTFWLSSTPSLPSKGWDAALNRICTWALFEDISGFQFYVFNTHFDHVGQQAREESSRLILAKIQEINKENLPVIFLGDFNVNERNPAYQFIINSGFKSAADYAAIKGVHPGGTFNAFRWDWAPTDVIDHIFFKGDVRIEKYGILTDHYGLKYPSDHFPVMARIQFFQVDR